MVLYRVKYTESEYDIKNNDLLYKIDQTHQNTFDYWENVEKLKQEKFVRIIYKFHNSYFVIWIFCNFWI